MPTYDMGGWVLRARAWAFDEEQKDELLLLLQRS
jgi:hypothetical protein